MAEPLPPSALRCEYLNNPIGIDVVRPRLSWTLNHTDRGQSQTAYQIVAKRGDAVQWDSGKVDSPQSTLVEYSGPKLSSATRYTWQVRYWDRDGRPSPYSATAFFETGFLDPSEWKAKWISPGNHQVRTDFTVRGAVKRARAYAAAAGYYELRINGHKVGDRLLDPGYTTYAKRVLYTTYDITPLIHTGPNAAGLMFGEGRFGLRQGIAQIVIDTDAGTQIVGTDEKWRMHSGPLVADSVYNGEVYDARLENTGWDQPGFDAAGWEPVKVVPSPTRQLSAMMMPPVRIVADITPLEVTSPQPGMYVYDMGQNFSGFVRLRAEGPAGTRIRLRFAELLYSDGTINVENLRAAKATDVFILRGTGDRETYQPRFTYHGFRYVEVTGYPGVPPAGAVVARVIHNDVRPIGGFNASKLLLNQIQRITQWGIRSNLVSVPTDCNQRDERMGWTADAHLAAETAMLNYDMGAFYTNFIRDMHDEQTDAGMVPDTVPFKWGGEKSDPAWGVAYPMIISYMYDQYGDRRIVEDNYEGIKKWLGYLRGLSQDHIVSHANYGDWVPIEFTPKPLTSTFYYLYSAEIAARAARIVGKMDEATAYDQEAAAIRAAFQKTFWNPELGAYGNGTNTSDIMALFLNAAPKETRGAAQGHLVNDIVYTHDTHLNTGILGTKYALPLLTRMGRSDLAYELATQTTFPSWGYMISHGATTLWELWQEKTGPSMNSHNHPMFGSIGAWFYTALAGINVDPQHPGYEHIIVRPQVVRDLKWATGSIDTQRGPVAVSWDRSRGPLDMQVTVPVGSTAEIHIPKLQMTAPHLTESGTELAASGTKPSGVTSVKESDDAYIVETGSGVYHFRVE